ncbi:rod-binding protein [Gracilinema caldarium]|uniref:rod-binding protein n=1 Tax=Gracilinema caldarium TaxID=215591 RepID=UPI0026EA54FC|nr:rod-binding protein [Gracilinema caldarium]
MKIGEYGSYLVQQNLISGSAGPVPAENDASFAALLEKAKKTDSNTETNEKPSAVTSDRHTSNVHIDKKSKLYEQCEALESFLVKNLLEGMRKTVMKSELIDEGFAGKMYEDMLYDHYAESMTKNSGFGLADLAYIELTGQRGKVITSQ